MSFDLPPIVKLAERLQADIEVAVARWPRQHRYAHGAQLRAQAMAVTKTAHQAWRDRGNQLQRIRELVIAVDDLKLDLQLGMRIKCFASFRQFEAMAKQLKEIGRQVGGWHKQQHLKSQNCAQTNSPHERAQILSIHAAPSAMSPGANP